MKTKEILTAGAIALSMILTGCSSTSTDTKDTKTTEVAKKKEVKTIGQKSKDSKSLKITNNTGKKITVFETKSSSEESFSDNLLEDGDSVKNKEERTLYYTVKENDKLDVKIGLQDQDKTFVFKDVDTTDTKKVDVSLKDDKVNLDVTKKDGTTATLTPSEDSAKTEDEKKDETEVKQEEKLTRMVIVPVNAAGKVPEETLGDGKQKACDIYDNMTTYLWGTVKDALMMEEVSLENDNELVAQFTCRKYRLTSRGKMLLESKEEMKKRGIDSPDRADAVALSCYQKKTFNIGSLVD